MVKNQSGIAWGLFGVTELRKAGIKTLHKGIYLEAFLAMDEMQRFIFPSVNLKNILNLHSH